MNVPGVIGEVSAEFMALRFIVCAGSYDCDERGQLEENYKRISGPMDYYAAKAYARSLRGYCFVKMERDSAPEARAEGTPRAGRNVD